MVDNVDGNMYALNKHLDSVEKAEQRYEAFRDEVESNCVPQYNEAYENYRLLLDKYGYDENEYPFHDEMEA